MPCMCLHGADGDSHDLHQGFLNRYVNLIAFVPLAFLLPGSASDEVYARAIRHPRTLSFRRRRLFSTPFHSDEPALSPHLVIHQTRPRQRSKKNLRFVCTAVLGYSGSTGLAAGKLLVFCLLRRAYWDTTGPSQGGGAGGAIRPAIPRTSRCTVAGMVQG